MIWVLFPLFLAAVNCLPILFIAARHPGIFGLHDYEVREDGLLEETAVNTTLTRWDGIRGVKETRSLLLIRQTSGLVHIIPRRSFADPGTCRHFAELVRQKIEESKLR